MMKFVWYFCMVAELWIHLVNCRPCDLNDQDCTTRFAQDNYKVFVNGVTDSVHASDPLHRDLIVAELPTMTYKYSNATLSGMSGCEVTKLKVYQADSSFEYHLECPSILVLGDIVVHGSLGPIQLDDNGVLTVSCTDYIFEFSGHYETHIHEDNQNHAQITDFIVKPYARGNVRFTLDLEDDKEKSAKLNDFLDDHWKSVDEIMRAPTVNSFMQLFIKNINAYLKIVPTFTAHHN